MADEETPEGAQGWPPPPAPGAAPETQHGWPAPPPGQPPPSGGGSAPAPPGAQYGGWDAPPPQPGTGWDPNPPPPPSGGGWAPPPPPGAWAPPPPGGPPTGPPTGGWGSPPYQGQPYQGQPYQAPPYQGPPYQGPPYQGPPYQGPPYQGPPYQAPGLGGWPPPPYQDPYGRGPGRPGPTETEKLSVWSLVLGIASFVVLPVIAAIAAIVTGTKGKKAIRNSGGAKSGRGMATAGQLLGVANIVLTVLLGVVIAVGANYVSHHKSYTSLQAGDCFNKSGVGSLVTTVSCVKPHQQEAIGSFQFQADPSTGWPGPSGFAPVAKDQCTTLAMAYMGTPNVNLQLVYVYPNQQSWDNGTRKVVCSVRNRDGTKRIGSVKSGPGPVTNG